MQKSLAIAIFLVGVSVSASMAGYANFLCPTQQNTTVFFPCALDCVHQHGAVTGSCGKLSSEDFNCYCEKTKFRQEQGFHCAEDTGNYRELCVVDCQCNHGARSGVCDFEKKACQCTGRDSNNSQCQMRNVIEFAKFTAKMMPLNSPAWAFLSAFVSKDYLNQ